jgi:LuxR family transcriptional regulator, maltose regulon positive regulatory protein
VASSAAGAVAPAPRSTSQAVVPLTRLGPPAVPRATVVRPRLLDALSTSVERPLTLLIAPAGSGKTVLLSSWLAAGAAPGRVAWLTVDRPDDDPARFWAAVLATLRHSNPASSAAALPSSTEGFDEELLATLMNDLYEADEPLMLVIDNFDVIGNKAVLDGVDHMLRHAPPELHLMIATRSDPLLSLGRLRVRRDLTEIRAAALAFTVDEAADLFAASGIRLPDDDVDRLVTRTEGWAAGLALAAMSLEGAPDPVARVARFAGDDRAVVDFLATEVLAHIPSDVHEYLVQTSVVDEICPALAKALTGRRDSTEMLHELVRTNSFVVALDSSGGWYRCHNLFLQFLRNELVQRDPARLKELHRRAAEWFAAEDLPLDAISHALEAEDWPLASSLLRDHWLDAFLSGRVHAMSHLLTRLPAELTDDDPQLALAYAGSYLELGDVSKADKYLKIAKRAPAEAAAKDTFVEALAIVMLNRAQISGDLEAAATSARELLADETADNSPFTMQRPSRRALAMLLLGEAELWTDRPTEARRHLKTALALARESEEDYVVIGCLSHLALLEALSGRLRPAAVLAREAIELARTHRNPTDRAVAPAHLAAATAQLEWNDAAAAGSISQATAGTGGAASAVLRVAVALVEARIRARDEGPTGAQRGIERLEAALDRTRGQRLSRSLEQRVRGVMAALLLTVGEAAEAKTWLENGTRSPYTAVVEARLALADADPVHALEVLRPDVDATAETYLGTRVEALVLRAMAYRAQFEPERAAESLERALDLADPDGFHWRFVHAGAPLRDLLVQQIRAGTAHRALVDDLLAEMAAEAMVGSPLAQDRELLDPLTDREETVLRYLPTLLSNAEIASELFVSINTVKAHVKSIYRKLGTGRRKDAVLRARELRLL